MIHGHEIDPPDELPCRECWDRDNRPHPRALLVDILENIGLDGPGVTTYAEAAIVAPWWSGFTSLLYAAYDETVAAYAGTEWTTCSRCAGEIQADMARE